MDLTENPERFTGYSGPSAAKVWDAIYNENCFNVAQKMQLASDCEQCSLDRENHAKELEEKRKAEARLGFSRIASGNGLGMGSGLGGVGGVGGVGGAHNRHMDAEPVNNNQLTGGGSSGQDDEICLEKRVFYRMISGLHTSISIHICDEYFNQTTGVWVRSKDSYWRKRKLCSVTYHTNLVCPLHRALIWNALYPELERIRIVWKTSILITQFWSVR